MEEVSEVKHEFGTDNMLQCRACLSVGRILRPLEDLASIYAKITSELYTQEDSFEPVLLCWQCSSLLKKVVLFKEQVKTAGQLLQSHQNFIYGPLSNLATVTLNDTSQTIYIYDGQINMSNIVSDQTVLEEIDLNDTNQEISDNEINIKDLKEDTKQVKSRWAIKRAILNKKPKFKVCGYSKDSFKKVQIGNNQLEECLTNEIESEYYKSKRFKCDKCVLAFQNQRILDKHVKRLHCINSNSFYTCDICKSKMSNKRHLLSHLSKHYYVYKCVICQFICRKGMRSWHFEKEHKKVYQCLRCKLQFGTRRIFFKHFKEWHEKFTCDYCGISFKMKYCLKDHIRKQHSPFECKACNKTFARYNGLWLHNRLVHRPASPAYCAECDTHYTDIYRLKWHLCNSVKHSPRDKLRIPCSGCDKIFSKKIYMTDHYNLVHLKVFKYRCEACDKNFIRNADLMKHKRKIHEGILPPKNKICYICGRGFTTNKILHNHVRTHNTASAATK